MPELDSLPTAPASDRYIRWTGLLVGLIAARIVGNAVDKGGEDIGILYAVTAFGLCAVAGVLAGDALTARPSGTVRTAGLTPRRFRDYVPPRMTVLLLAQAGILVALMIMAAVLAESDGRHAGRSLTLTCPDGSTATMTPWPGIIYGLPILGSLAVSTAACLWSLAWIARRPGDDRTRHDRALAVVAAWGLLVSAFLLGAASTASGALMSTNCDGVIGQLGNGLLWPAALVALLTTSWCLFTVISPKARIRR